MFHYTLQPRFSETDCLGHINNAVLPVWLEEARTDLFRLFNPSLAMKTWNLILRKYEVDLIAQIWREHRIEILTSIEKIGNSSLTVLQRVRQNGQEVAVGRTVLVHFDYEAARSVPIPEEIRLLLQPHVEPGV
jgi:acyl-CoA thioester hydrolase